MTSFVNSKDETRAAVSLRLSGILRSELVKVRALRVVKFAVPAAFLALVLGGLIAASLSRGSVGEGLENLASLDGISSAGSLPASLLMAVATVSIFSSEFASGTYFNSLLAVPRREYLFMAKAGVAIATAVAVAVAGILLTVAFSAFIVPVEEIGRSVGHGAYLLNSLASLTSIVALVALAAVLAQFIRSSAGTISALLAAIFGPFLASSLLYVLGLDPLARALTYTPGPLMNSSQLLPGTEASQAVDAVDPALAVVLLWCWGIVALVLAYAALRSRDARMKVTT